MRDVVYRKICDALRDLVPFVEFKKREKDLWRSVTFSKVCRNDTELGRVHNMLKSSKDMSGLEQLWMTTSLMVSLIFIYFSKLCLRKNLLTNLPR